MLEFTGERVIPDKMVDRPEVYSEHLMRYAFATRYCASRAVLDVACGTGYGMKLIEPIARVVYGGDLNADTLRYAKKYYNLEHVYKVDLSKDKLNKVFKRKFDLIISFETVEHIQNYKFFMNCVKDSLVPGGFFIMSIPIQNRSEFHLHDFSYNQAMEFGTHIFKNVSVYAQTATMIVDTEIVTTEMNHEGVYLLKVMT